MSVTNNKAPESIFDKQDSNKLKERQRLEELKRQTKIQQVKLDKRLNKQKILMGAFLGQVLATKGDDEQMIREYFAIHFPDFLTRKSDKFLFKSMIESLGGDIGLGDEEDSLEIKQKEKSQKAINEEVEIKVDATEQGQPEKFVSTTDRSPLDFSLGETDYSDQGSHQNYHR